MSSTTLIEVLKQRSRQSNTGITFINSGEQENYLSYKELYHSALRSLSHLQKMGMSPKDELVFQIDDNKTFVITYWACLLGGIIPVPLTIGQNDDHKQKLFNIWEILNNPFVVSSKSGLTRLEAYANQNGLDKTFDRIKSSSIDQDDVISSKENGEIYKVHEDDIAFIQFSSGSTGSPKGVVLTHKNLITNVAAISAASGYTNDDSMISWMPLTHDMGLIGFHINPLFIGMNHYLMPTNLFVRRPALWLDKVTQHKVSILCSPNFGYRYVLKHCNVTEDSGWDLSSVRLLYNGAEPISVQLSSDFIEALTKFGLPRNAMCPVYGLAEASLAVSISNLEDEVISYDFDRDLLNFGDQVVVVQKSDHSVSFVNVGKAINDCQVRITNDDNEEVGDEVIGHVQIKGDNVTSGYYNNQEATKSAIVEGNWLRTGDLGFVKDGSLYITGRVKDIIFVNGQNFYPHDIERVAEQIEGIELNKIAVVGHFNPEKQKEEVVAFVFHRGGLDKFIPLLKELKSFINTNVGFELDRVIPVKDIPRTTSGKLQRFKLLQEYKNGEFEQIEIEVNELLQEAGLTVPQVEPANDNEHKLADIWKGILGLEQIGVTQSFFEIGGNSLKAAEMSMAFAREFQADMPLEVLYEKPTIRELVDEIPNLEKLEYKSIPVAKDQSEYTLSSPQRRLFYAWQMNKEAVAYNTPIAFNVSGKIDKQKLERSINQIAEAHDSLRMTFKMSGGKPVFKVSDKVEFTLDVAACYYNETAGKLKHMVKPFDLEKGPLFRAAILEIENHDPILFLDFHHIISDGLSVYSFLEELARCYEGQLPSGQAIGYKDFTLWEKEYLTSPKVEAQRGYWLNQLAGELPVLEMPTDSPRPLIFDSEGSKIEFELKADISSRLRQLAKDNNCTLHVLMYTIYCVLLSKYTGQQELVIGIPVAGRKHPDLQKMQGMFVNNMAVKSSIPKNVSFKQLLQFEKDRLSEALTHQDYPFDQLVNEIDDQRDVSRNPVFDTMFIYQNMGFPKAYTSDFSLTRHFFDPGFSKFDISMEVFDYEQSIKYAIEYADKLFEKETILRLRKHFESLVETIVHNPGADISQISMLPASEYDWYVKNYNQTERDYPKGKVIHQLFEEQVKATPDAIAVEFEGETLTYQQLNDNADCLADTLRQKGIEANHMVGVLLPRSPELVVTILGILKAGGSYLPLDTELPEERVNYILTHSQCNIAITITAHESRLLNWQLGATDLNPVILNLDKESLIAKDNNEIKNINKPSDLAYIIYTSGTTGKPKGVMIEHHSLVNYICWASDQYVGGEQATFPLYTSISFDLTITSIFTPLVTGNKLMIYQDVNNDLLINKIVTDNKVNVVKLTPSHLKLITESKVEIPVESSIKRFIVGGEELEQRLAHDIYNKFSGKIDICNEYGPTEATVGCMIHRFDPSEHTNTVPIGVPASNTQVYILDRFLQPVPTGVKGEMYISGDGLARGYLFSEALTDERFIANPFIVGQKMYKTGDIAKRLANGTLEFIGRADQQVKINGYRIELAEIENCLMGFSGIDEALVIAKLNQKDKKVIYAYFISDSDKEISELRSYLADQLPHYMIPAYFVKIDTVPLTKNGKVDYGALPEPEQTGREQDSVSSMPKNDVERISLKVWSEVFGEEDLSVTDNFFELGGDSIKAVQISSRLNEEGISLNVKDILTYHTIEQISQYAEMAGESRYEQGLVEGKRELTPIEGWFFSQEFKNPDFYNQSVLLKLNRKVNPDSLNRAFVQVIEHHDGLRLNFDSADNTLVYGNIDFGSTFSISKHKAKDADELQQLCESLKQQTDLENGLMLKAGIVQYANDGERLLITAHHLAVDGISWRVLLEDLYKCYTALEQGEVAKLSAKTGSLIDWYDQLLEFSRSEEVQLSEEYWDEVENIDFSIPVDNETEDWTCANLKKAIGVLPEPQTSYLLKEAHHTYNTDVPILLNVALAITLKEWTRAESFVVEHENHGRHLTEVNTSRTVGWFTSMYPVKLKLKEDTMGEQIKSIKEQMRSVPTYGMGYGIAKYMNGLIEEKSGAEIRFNYLGQFDGEMNNDLFSLSSEFHGRETAPENEMTAKLEINLMVMNGELTIDIIYNEKAHTETTMGWFKDSYLKNIERVLEHIEKQSDVHFSPSDFDSAELSEEDLDILFS
ncbi:amino acid adenylation domain-containing protein [Fulvivirga sp. 29W222]|uniref:Amino acid adenylation domain-containing protein n=1 Tax=Fulvivirga marina TaxID=2494733 RepID=A0A937G0E7_9BACT|nr:non-ribosomal peptide synthetase [Fulvivirga marina]MBL6448227.1 amino acid adenylation domain-containing protein [Fulvivirga marina]